ncbi:PRC-barrel domain-containing protein [Pelosinus sp. sgz500959]|uniref:PRC-barrel domain-containing protein n=1 Tax=Pelosinus sp. sgz500959 TaxID=3242472 RepID=UPI00366E60F1
MKKSLDILGLPVIDISEGDEIGTITKIVIDPAEGSVAALVIDDGKWYRGAKLLPFSAIAGLGESALTIISSSAILSIENSPALEQLLCNDVTIIGTKVLTKTGRIQGIVKEIIVDMTGRITVCEIEEPNGEVSTIDADRILTFGKKVLVIADENEIVNTPVSTPAPEVVAAPEVKIEAPAKETPVKENASDDSARKFDEKQRKYLLGKQASRRIETDNGVVIVEQGGEINEEVLQKAKLAGKFVELSMNIQ